ncbi:MAG TPA: hypothetical protein VFE66_00955, partial [Bacteroidales bacterium]|nr:hypothetical protein [Bacteroidales bacterium]
NGNSFFVQCDGEVMHGTSANSDEMDVHGRIVWPKNTIFSNLRNELSYICISLELTEDGSENRKI